ncbi:MAG TPA: AAA family ATPase [Steroidobacteraceae bacterium]
MKYLLLLVGADGAVTTSPLRIRDLRELPGEGGLSVHFRPIRNDALFESAKLAGQLAYRILAAEGIVRSRLVIEYQVLGAHVNVVGRSSDLLFALSIITASFERLNRRFPAIAATGALHRDDASFVGGADSEVRLVTHTVAKVAAAVRTLADEPEAIVFYPAEAAGGVTDWSREALVPPNVRLQPVDSLENALSILGITLEKTYLGNPFRGLEHFDYAHRAIFFGRDEETRAILLQLLRREAGGSPGILVEGASGSGKSSFLRAAVLPALVNPGSQSAQVQSAIGAKPIRESVRFAIWRVGLLPAGASEFQFQESIRECWRGLPELSHCLKGSGSALLGLAQELLAVWPSQQRFVWLLDQFEELLSLGLDSKGIDAFGEFLIALQTGGVWTLASIRADTVPQLKQFPTLRQVFGSNEGHYYLETLAASALEDVIDRPTQIAGLRFGFAPNGTRLDKLLMDEVHRDRENALPLLQFTLYELCQSRHEKELTFAAYQKLGGLTGSVATTAEAVLNAEGPELANERTDLFRSLVSVDDLGGASRRFAPLDEFDNRPVQKRLLERLIESRLCVTDQRDGQSVVAFAHESLLRTWPTLVEWLRNQAGLLQLRDMAQRETRQWQQHGQSADWLASADKLAVLLRLEIAGIPLRPAVRVFIDRSVQRARRARRIRRTAVAMIAVLAIVASLAGWVASQKQHEAELQAQETLKAQARLLTEAAAQRLKEPDIAGALGIIVEVLTNPKLEQGRTAATISVFQEVRASDAQIAVLSGHTDFLRTAAYSPDGSRIVTASLDKTARIWDAYTGAEIAVLRGHEDRVNSAVYSPDGKYVLTSSSDRTARIWDARTGIQVAAPLQHPDRVTAAVYSPEGARIATGSFDRRARIWDARTGALLLTLSGHDATLTSIAFSPDGKRIATTSLDKTVRFWDCRTGAQLALRLELGASAESVAYSQDSSRILTASDDRTARIWDAHSGAQLAVLSGHGRGVVYARYSPDSSRIVTASSDKTARIWDAATGKQLAVLSGHGDRLASAVYSPDGSRVVTASVDGTARVWDALPASLLGVMRGHKDFLRTAAYSSDGSRIVTASYDQTARVWDVRTLKPLAIMSGHADRVLSAQFNPSGSAIVTSSDDKTGRVWDSKTSEPLALLTGHSATAESAAYSPDGAEIVTASFDHTARIWDARSGKLRSTLSAHSATVESAAYSRDGSRIVTASDDKTARIWDAHLGTPIAVLAGHDAALESAAFSPDGSRIVTASDDRTVRVWDLGTGAQLAVLYGHRGPVESAEYSPDGRYIVSGSSDGTARIWDANNGVQLAVLLGDGSLVASVAFSPDGAHIVTASFDRTAQIWDAHIPADIQTQISWAAAAQVDSIPDIERTRLGLPTDLRVRHWLTKPNACDRATAAMYDPDRLAPGIAQQEINGDIARSVCNTDSVNSAQSGRRNYQSGRALMASRDARAAMNEFELAAAEGYRVARVDLADLLTDETAAVRGAADPLRAISLYEEAWRDKVAYAAFRLGRLYELGASGAPGRKSVAPDLAKAWYWYRQAAGSGQPNGLARLAERDEMSAVGESGASKRNVLLLHAFVNYAAAADRAMLEDWPDAAWKHWRYRRATLARLLARDGLMVNVAQAYAARGTIHRHEKPDAVIDE